MSGLARYSFGGVTGFGEYSTYSPGKLVANGLVGNWQAHAAAVGFAGFGHPIAAAVAETAAIGWTLMGMMSSGLEFSAVQTLALIGPPVVLGAGLATLGYYVGKRKRG